MYIYKNIVTLEPGKRSGKPCIRGMRITVEDILRWLASGMSFDDILEDFPELTRKRYYCCFRIFRGPTEEDAL